MGTFVTLAEVLEARGSPLDEDEVWCLLYATTEALLEISKKGNQTHLIFTNSNFLPTPCVLAKGQHSRSAMRLNVSLMFHFPFLFLSISLCSSENLIQDLLSPSLLSYKPCFYITCYHRLHKLSCQIPSVGKCHQFLLCSLFRFM